MHILKLIRDAALGNGTRAAGHVLADIDSADLADLARRAWQLGHLGLDVVCGTAHRITLSDGVTEQEVITALRSEVGQLVARSVPLAEPVPHSDEPTPQPPAKRRRK